MEEVLRILSVAVKSNLQNRLSSHNYWLFGLCPTSGILEIRKHNASETASVSVLKWEGGDTYSCGTFRKS
jgi:hypothetical protein